MQKHSAVPARVQQWLENQSDLLKTWTYITETSCLNSEKWNHSAKWDPNHYGY